MTFQQPRESTQLPSQTGESDDAVPGVAAVQEVASVVSSFFVSLLCIYKPIELL